MNTEDNTNGPPAKAKPYRMKPLICTEGGCQRKALEVGDNDVDALSKSLCFKCLKDAKLSRGWVDAFHQFLLRNGELHLAELDGLQFAGHRNEPRHLPDGVDFSVCSMRHARLAYVNARGARFRWIEPTDAEEMRILPISDVTFVGCDLREARFETPRVTRVCFEDCDLSRAKFGDLREMEGCDFHRVDFFGSKLRKLTLRNVDIDTADFAEAEITKLTVEGGHWKNVDLSNARVRPEQVTVTRKLTVNDNCTLPRAFRSIAKRWKDDGLVEGEFKYSEEEYAKIQTLHDHVRRVVSPRSYGRLWDFMDRVTAASFATICLLATARISESTAGWWPWLAPAAFLGSFLLVRTLEVRRGNA